MTNCQICGFSGQRKTHVASEMMVLTGETFTIAECPHCGALELLDVPDDLSPYYPPDYHAFQGRASGEEFGSGVLNWIKPMLKAKRAQQVLGRPGFIGAIALNRYCPPLLRWLGQMHARLSSRVLDIGCGNGGQLLELEQWEMASLTGIDPFLAQSSQVGHNIRLIKETIYEHDGQYDVVMLHHSFEHMSDPVQVMRRLAELLAPDGAILIRIPLADSFAWRHYGTDWVQLDPPRHLFIHTRKSMARLAAQAGLEIIHVECDSHEFQFTGSELVRRGIPFSKQSVDSFTKTELAEYRSQAANLNRNGEGDQAAFILKRAGAG